MVSTAMIDKPGQALYKFNYKEKFIWHQTTYN
jgi:hypothetical protein